MICGRHLEAYRNSSASAKNILRISFVTFISALPILNDLFIAKNVIYFLLRRNSARSIEGRNFSFVENVDKRASISHSCFHRFQLFDHKNAFIFNYFFVFSLLRRT